MDHLLQMRFALQKSGSQSSSLRCHDDRPPFAISVLNIQPDDVVGNVEVIKALVDGRHISLIPVVPPALVVAQGKELGHGCCACHLTVLL